MPTLSYDFSIVGLAKVNQALAGLERRLAQHNARAARLTGMAGPGAARGGPYRAAPARELAAQQRTHQQMLNAERRFQEKLSRERDRARQKEVAKELRSLKDAERARTQAAKSMARSSERRAALGGQIVGRAGRGVGRVLSSVGRIGATALTIGGGMAFSNAINVEKSIQAQAAALANQAIGTAGGKGKTFDQLKGTALQLARTEGVRSGQGPEAVIGAMRQFSAITGRFDIGSQMTQYMTELSDATDAGLSDVGETAGRVFASVMNQLPAGADKANRAMEVTKQIMDSMAYQSKVGSIEMKDLATQMGALMSQAGAFKGDVGDLADSLGAMAQIAVSGEATNVEEAMTALRNFVNDLTKKGSDVRGQMAKMGIDPYAYSTIGGKKVATKLKDPIAIVEELLTKSLGDVRKTSQVFAIRGMKAFSELRKVYTTAEEQQAGTGIAAVREKLGEFRGKGAEFGAMRGQLATNRRNEADRKFASAMAKFNDAIGQQLLPKLTELVPKFTEMVPGIVKATDALLKLADFATQNPFTSLGAVFAGFMLKELAVAGIGSAIQSSLIPGFTAAGASATSLSGSFNSAGIAIAAAAAAVGLAVDQGIKLYNEIQAENARIAGERENLMSNAERQGQHTVERERTMVERLNDPSTWLSGDGGKEYLMRGKGGNVVAMSGEQRSRWEESNAPISIPMTKSKYDWSGVDEKSSAASAKNEAAAAKNEAAAAKNEAAASKIAAAADKFAAASLNRGNAPSPTASR